MCVTDYILSTVRTDTSMNRLTQRETLPTDAKEVKRKLLLFMLIRRTRNSAEAYCFQRLPQYTSCRRPRRYANTWPEQNRNVPGILCRRYVFYRVLHAEGNSVHTFFPEGRWTHPSTLANDHTPSIFFGLVPGVRLLAVLWRREATQSRFSGSYSRSVQWRSKAYFRKSTTI